MRKSYLKTAHTDRFITLDSATNEILNTEVISHKYLANSKEEFFMCYSSLIGVFMKMSQAEIRVFGYCLRYAKGVKFDISKKLRQSMAIDIELNERTILNTLPSLLEKTVLYQHPDGLYQINPRFAYQGSTSERNQALKAIIELGCESC